MKIIQKPSPYFNERTAKIDMLVIHATATETLADTFGYLIEGQGPAPVSAHYVIDRDGTVYQLVDESKRAWHAGVSFWGDMTDLNSHSIGIEFQCPAVSADELGTFSEAQIEAGLVLCRDIMTRYHIPLENVVAHSDIAPGRKKDPGKNFPWNRFVAAGLALANRRPKCVNQSPRPDIIPKKSGEGTTPSHPDPDI